MASSRDHFSAQQTFTLFNFLQKNHIPNLTTYMLTLLSNLLLEGMVVKQVRMPRRQALSLPSLTCDDNISTFFSYLSRP